MSNMSNLKEFISTSKKSRAILIVVAICCFIVFVYLQFPKKDNSKVVLPALEKNNAVIAETTKVDGNTTSNSEEVESRDLVADAKKLLAKKKASSDELLFLGRRFHGPRATVGECDLAFMLIEKAAKQDNTEAMFLIGQFYDPGNMLPKGSVVPNWEQARKWYSLAMDRGYIQGKAALNQLRELATESADLGDAEAKKVIQAWTQ